MKEPFSDLFKDSAVFANREVLSPHYMPENLPFREKQIESIVKYMTPSLRGERGRNLFVYGKTGTGKTSCVKHVVDKIKDLPTKAPHPPQRIEAALQEARVNIDPYCFNVP